ncbi:MAG: WcaF family extracellular polysaccharide biosynthesis acetyltransferase [Bacteroidota bacterium]
MSQAQQQLKKNFDKQGYTPGASKLKCVLWYVMSLMFFKSGVIPFSNVLVYILRAFGASIGAGVRIKPFIHIKYPWKLTVGNNCWLSDCYIENLDGVVIANNVCVSQQAMLLTGNHNYKMSSFDLITSGIVLENGTWIGAKAIICPGVKVKSHSIIFAGSVLTKDSEPYCIYQGNPALLIRKRLINDNLVR